MVKREDKNGLNYANLLCLLFLSFRFVGRYYLNFCNVIIQIIMFIAELGEGGYVVNLKIFKH